MEEEKAAAYYEELTRKGEGAAKFKQGLGFSSSSSSSSDHHSLKRNNNSSLFSNFVAANPIKAEEDLRRKNQSDLLSNIHNKLNNKTKHTRGEHENKYTERRSRSRSPPSRSSRDHRDRDRDRDRDYRREKKSSGSQHREVDYSKLIQGYSSMTPAERVKAKMKLQLSQTAKKDTTMGMSTGWERFDFNKDAPLDDDEEEIEVADDDAALVKNIGRSFRFSAVEARREEEVKAAHDQAMFGGATAASQVVPVETAESAKEGREEESDTEVGHNEISLGSSSLINDKVLSMRQGSWRDRARRSQNG